MFSKTHSPAYMRCDFLGFNLITALKEDTFDYWSCCEWMQLPKQKCEWCAFCNNIDDWLKGRGLTSLYFGFPCMYSVSFNRVTSSLPNIFISQGTNSIVQVMTPRDLLTNQVVSQTLWSEFKPVTLWKKKKGGLNHIIMEMSPDPITTHYYMNHCNIVASMHTTIDIEINSQVLTDTHRSKGQKYKLEETLETGLEIRGTQ